MRNFVLFPYVKAMLRTKWTSNPSASYNLIELQSKWHYLRQNNWIKTKKIFQRFFKYFSWLDICRSRLKLINNFFNVPSAALVIKKRKRNQGRSGKFKDYCYHFYIRGKIKTSELQINLLSNSCNGFLSI